MFKSYLGKKNKVEGIITRLQDLLQTYSNLDSVVLAKESINIPVGLNRESGNSLTHMWLFDFCQRHHSSLMWKEKSFQPVGLDTHI